MGICRMTSRLDIRRIVVKQVKYELAFMLMSANDPAINWNMVCYERTYAYAFIQTKVLRRVSRVKGVNFCFNTLPIATGM